jgi:predicted acetylornithine/succinylornithine family transaminase
MSHPLATSLSSKETIELFDQYVIGNYTRYPACLVRGEGSEIWDAEGNRYLDFFPGWGCDLLGHSPARIVEAVREQVGQLIHVPNTWYMESQGRFAQSLVERSFPGKVFFCNSGAEANEGAIKLARAHAAPRTKIITALDSFHGRTLGAVSATGQPKYQQGFGPLVPGFKHVPYADIDAMAKGVDDETAAIMVEPIQGEGGVNIPPAGYLAKLRQLCDDRGVLLIFDEVQTGMGRTGRWFAHQHEEIEPDIMTLAKSIAGGIAGGAIIAKTNVAGSLRPGMHASTFGGNPILCRAGLAYIETIDEEGLLDRAVEVGEHFLRKIEPLRDELGVIRDVRVRGVMIGIELAMPGAGIVKDCLEHRLLINCTHDTVLRLLPAMNISDEQIEEGFEILEQAIRRAAGH